MFMTTVQVAQLRVKLNLLFIAINVSPAKQKQTKKSSSNKLNSCGVITIP